MSIRFAGFKKDKFLIEESIAGVQLRFTGPDADKFAQVKVPRKHTKTVEFSLTVDQMKSRRMLNARNAITTTTPRPNPERRALYIALEAEQDGKCDMCHTPFSQYCAKYVSRAE